MRGSEMNEDRQADVEPILEVRDLRASVGDRAILKGVDLAVRPGEVHALMGRNGSGKSTLSHVLMGHPAYRVDGGEVRFLGQDLLAMDVTERARAGLFLGFQHPVAVPGVTVTHFLRNVLRSRGRDLPAREFRGVLRKAFDELGIADEFAGRSLNDGFSGGERKRLEVLQLRLLRPALALMDETDSGLDIDALKVVSEGINASIREGVSVVLVTHYQRILQYVQPQVVHVFLDGRVARSGGPDLARELEARGYDWIDAPQA